METGGGADRMRSDDREAAGGRRTAVGAGGGGYGPAYFPQLLVGMHSRPREGSKVGSVISPGPGGGVELKETRLGPLSRASSSAMLVAIWLTVPSTTAMRAWSSVAAEYPQRWVGSASQKRSSEYTSHCVGWLHLNGT
ncbi:hypothetical protein CRG98_006465 [Punica granatum]|uniref:Uncharacterized protein n=1 Tax=Punica granatum TaxID=22663 RepID=A0A2I0KXP7_PUNGR|nr:hypothetical protein CRG98_006465 [Punica granatum]